MGLQDIHSTQQGSSDMGRGRGNKADKGEKLSRRTWSAQEEAVLIAALKELVATNWKSDNGFKPRYLIKCEEALKKEFPGTDLKSTPHINSKLQMWKKNYHSLVAMLNRSGVGFSESHVIDATPEQWEQMIKCDPNAKSMRHKSWPMFEDWKEIFGKDRATGENAEDIMQAVNDLMHEDKRAEGMEGEGDYHINLDDISVNDVGENSVYHSDKSEAVNKKSDKGKKRKAVDPMHEIVTDVLREITRDMNDKLENIAGRIGYEFDLELAKKDTYPLLDTIPGLTRDQKFDLCEIFSDKPDRLTIFKGLPLDAREPYIHRLLKSKQQ